MTPTSLSPNCLSDEFWSKVAIIIPAYNEQALIQKTLQGLPQQVGAIFVIDDASSDRTKERTLELGLNRLSLIEQQENQGVGAAILRGYREALKKEFEWLVVMAGDNQMNPHDLPTLLTAGSEKQPFYIKGNRLIHSDFRRMPRHRRWGSRFLARLTGLFAQIKIDDAQCGYTALNRRAALLLDWERTWKGYGYPNDLLIQLAARGCHIKECAVQPIYENEVSGLRLHHFAMIIWVIFRRFFLEKLRKTQIRLTYSTSR